MDDTALIAAAVVVGGIALFSVSSGVNTGVDRVTGVIPWIEEQLVPGSSGAAPGSGTSGTAGYSLGYGQVPGWVQILGKINPFTAPLYGGGLL